MNRVVAIVAALVVAALAIVAGVLAERDDFVQLGVQVGILGWLALAAALLWWPALLAPAMVGVALPVAIAALGRTDATGAVVVATTLLVVTGELAGWSLDRRSVVPEDRAVTARRASTTAGVALGSAALAGVLAAAGLPAPGGALPVIAGTVAALAVLALAALRRW